MRVWWIAFVSTLVGLGAGSGIAAFILLPRISESTRDGASMPLELSENAQSHARAIRLTTANGWIAAPTVTLTSIDLAGATVSDMRAVVLEELTSYDGLLGLDFLARFDVDINAEAGEIVLIPR